MPSKAASADRDQNAERERLAQRTAELDAVNAELLARNRQQTELATLGLSAIRARDLQPLLDEAAAVVARTLGTEYSAVTEVLADGSGFLVRSGVGWKESIVGRTSRGQGTPAEYMLQTGEPIVIANAGTESRFAIPPPMREHGVASAIYVIIRGRDRLWGVLSAYATQARAFNADDIGFLQSVANVLALAVERHELEIAQRQEQEILQAVYDNIPVMISYYEESGRLLRANREWERKLGWSCAEAQSVDILAETYPDQEAQREVLGFIQRSERQWTDFRTRTRDGRVIDTSWARFALSDGSRIGFGLDLTERKQAEAALAESEARFAKLFEASPVALGMSTMREGRVLAVNESWLELFGFARDEVIGRTNRDLDISVDQEVRKDTLERLHSDGTARSLEMRLRRKSGEVLDVLVSAVVVHASTEREYTLTALTDITERKRAQAERERLLDSETRARGEAEAALERVRAILAITDSALVHLGVDELLRELLIRLRQALNAEAASVMLLDEEHGQLYARAWNGEFHPDVAAVRVRLGMGVSGKIVAEGRPLIVDDVSTMDQEGVSGKFHREDAVAPRSVMGAPLEAGEKVIGAVLVSSRHPRRFTEEDLDLIRLVADRVAPAMERARLVEDARATHERLGSLSHRLLTAQEEERRRVAVELHDELGQVLTAVKINLESLQLSTSRIPPPAQLEAAIGSVDEAMRRVRDLALDLRPAVLDDLGLPAALRWYTDRFAQDKQVEVHVSIDAIPDLEPGIATACFRVAQEALTNVARHARARHVWLDLHLLADGLELRVRDDGVGFDAVAARELATRGASMGLLGMQERVSLVGGELEMRVPPGGGTEVRAHFPL